MAEPRLIVLYGEDRFSRNEAVHQLKEMQRGLPAGEHNLEELEADEVDLSRIRASCLAAPFLAERRLVVVHGLLTRYFPPPASGGGSAGADGKRPRKRAAASADSAPPALQALLAELPATTLLVLVEERFDLDRVRAVLPGTGTKLAHFSLPRGEQLQQWVRERAAAKNLALSDEAVGLLCDWGEGDLGRLDNELAKLAAYADGRPVGADETRLLGIGRDEHIFHLLDAVSEGRSDQALAVLRALVDQGMKAEAFVPQLASLLRRLLIAREGIARRARMADLAREHQVSVGALSRSAIQARRLTGRQLNAALQRLLEADRAIKTGKREPEAELELAVARIAALLRPRA